MEIVTWRGFVSVARLALIGVGVAFAGALLSLFLGINAASAHAAEDGGSGLAEERGLLGAVTGVVSESTSHVGETLTAVASVAANAVETVTSTTVAVMPAPLQAPVQNAAETAAATVTGAIAPVQQAASAGVVDALTQPAIEAVTRLPLVGVVVMDLGVDAALTGAGAAADDLLMTTVDAFATTSSAVGSSPSSTPDALGAAATAEAGMVSAPSAGVLLRAHGQGATADFISDLRASVPSTLPGAAGTPAGNNPVPDLTDALCPSSLAGSSTGGSAFGAWALVGLLPVVAHPAWVRRAGSEDDALPPAAFFDTDVSPD